MSGHSKWATIKRAKAATDAKRGKIFSKLSREITIAAKMGGGDPEMNPRLRMVLLKAKGSNMPKDNIERAIEKGTGAGGEAFEDLIYEVYAPHGVGLLVEVSTDNRNRTAGEIRSIVSKAGGNIATSGSVTRFFERKGQIMIARDAADEETLMEIALEAGAEDFRAGDEGFEIITDPSEFLAVQEAIEGKEITFVSAEVTMLPVEGMSTPLSDAGEIDAVNRLIEKLEDNDDVKDVFSTAEYEESGEAVS